MLAAAITHPAGDPRWVTEERFRRLADLVPEQVWISGPAGALELVNGKVAEFGGGPPPGHVLQLIERVHPDDLDRAAVQVAARWAAGEPYAVELRLRRHDGEYRPHLARGYPERDEAGVVRWYGMAADRTDAHAQERLAASEAQLREAEQIARLGSFRWEAATGRTTFSPRLLRLLDMTPEEFGGRWQAFFERVHPDDRDAIRAQLRTARRGSGELAVDLRLLLPDGRVRVVHARGQATTGPGPDRRPGDFAGTIQDVTEQRAAEAAARGRDQAERASRAKSEFLSRMSHELRTPLNAILGFGQLLELDALSGDQRDSVGHILTAGGHLLELIDEILEISRIEAGALRLALQPVHLPSAVRGIVDLLAPLAAERDVELAVDAAPDPAVHVLADRQRLDQILLNLISNAIKYNRDGGLVTVRLRTAPDGRARVAVSDTGAGLTAEQLERVFSPFERLGAPDAGPKGTGLGLAVSRSLAEAMGGELTAASVPGCGCDFSLLLDHAPAPAPGVAAPAALPVARAACASAGRRRRVLCVEDNPSNLRLVERVLEPAGLDVIGAPEGRLGIDLARRHRPDVVLLDLDLPDISGEAVLAALGADPATAGIPVVICSADATAATMERLTAQGAADYLTKPVDMERLLKTVHARADEGPSR